MNRYRRGKDPRPLTGYSEAAAICFERANGVEDRFSSARRLFSDVGAATKVRKALNEISRTEFGIPETFDAMIERLMH